MGKEIITEPARINSCIFPLSPNLNNFLIHCGYEEISQPQHQQVNKAPTQKTPLQIFTELGLVGCIEGEPDLSANYKSVVKF